MAIKRGTNKRNTLNGTNSKDSLFGLGGNDTLNGKGGNDKLFGGTGHDKLLGGKGNDTLDGGKGNDTLDGGTGNDVMKGGLGDDTYIVDSAGDVVIDVSGTDIVLASVSYTLGADIENLILTGAAAINGTGNDQANTITGNAGANILTGGGGADTMLGGEGSDTYVLDGSNVPIGEAIIDSGTSGRDVITFLPTGLDGSVANAVYMGIEAITFSATQAVGFNASQFGTGLISNTVEVTGIAGQQILSIKSATNFSASGWQLKNWGSEDSVHIQGTSAGATLTGSSGNDQITGGDGVDTLAGGDGDDSLQGGVDADHLDGGEGSDTYVYLSSGDPDFDETINDSGTTVTDIDTIYLSGELVSFGFEDLAISGIEQLEFSKFQGSQSAFFGGSQFGPSGLPVRLKVVASQTGDVIRIRDATDFNATKFEFSGATSSTVTVNIQGTNGDDKLTGSVNADILDGGLGADTQDGGEGADQYLYSSSTFTAAGDIITDTGSSGTDMIVSYSGSVLDFTAATISGIEQIDFHAGRGAVFNASQLAGSLNWLGSDDYAVTVEIDNASAFTGAGWTFDNSGGGIAWDTSDVFLINGTGAADTITGTSQIDRIYGGFGGDTLNGGGGADKFVYSAVANSLTATPDTINGFSNSFGEGDQFDFSLMAAVLGAGDPIVYIANGAFTDTGIAQVRWVQTGPNIVEVQIDTDGETLTPTEMIITVNGVSALTAADFILF